MADEVNAASYEMDPEGMVAQRSRPEKVVAKGVPSNPVYARVGESVKRAAHDGVRRGLTPHDIIREIVSEHNVHLNVHDLRLLLAGRLVQE
ncbi:MAG: hypothetical protein ACR2JC_01650 [Chloroflexota bacterium]